MKRTAILFLAAVLALAAVVVPQAKPAGATATQDGTCQEGTCCSKHWHYIRAAAIGRNVKPADYYPILIANGEQDYWNQQFLFCRDERWGSNHYAIYANRGARYWNHRDTDISVRADAPGISDLDQLFEVKFYVDGYFWTIMSITEGGGVYANSYVYADPSNRYLWADRGQYLDGNSLFLVQPPDLMA